MVGTIHPQKVLSNDRPRPGDVLILTKPLGLGIISTAAKNGEDKQAAVAQAIGVMTTLNRAAAEVLSGFEVHALTDVTGFGLLGHLRNVVAASKVAARVWLERVPVLPAAWDYVRAGIAPGGTHANRRFLADWVSYGAGITKEEELVLCDAQTSGGLLAAVAPGQAEAALSALRAAGVSDAAAAGTIEAGGARIRVSRTPGPWTPAGPEHRPLLPIRGGASGTTGGAQARRMSSTTCPGRTVRRRGYTASLRWWRGRTWPGWWNAGAVPSHPVSKYVRHDGEQLGRLGS